MINNIILIGTAIPSVCYLVVAVAMYYNGNINGGGVWAGYAFANFWLMRTYGII